MKKISTKLQNIIENLDKSDKSAPKPAISDDYADNCSEDCLIQSVFFKDTQKSTFQKERCKILQDRFMKVIKDFVKEDGHEFDHTDQHESIVSKFAQEIVYGPNLNECEQEIRAPAQIDVLNLLGDLKDLKKEIDILELRNTNQESIFSFEDLGYDVKIDKDVKMYQIVNIPSEISDIMSQFTTKRKIKISLESPPLKIGHEYFAKFLLKGFVIRKNHLQTLVEAKGSEIISDQNNTVAVELYTKCIKKSRFEPKLLPTLTAHQNNANCLIVSGNCGFLRQFEKMLNKLNYGCDMAITGHETFMMSTKYVYELIIIDSNIKLYDSKTTCQKIKSRQNSVVIVQVNTDSNGSQNDHADTILQQPISEQDFKSNILSLLNERHSNEQRNKVGSQDKRIGVNNLIAESINVLSYLQDQLQNELEINKPKDSSRLSHVSSPFDSDRSYRQGTPMPVKEISQEIQIRK